MIDLELREQIDELFLLQRVAQRIAALLDIDVLLEEIVGDVAQTFGYSRSGVLLKDDLTNELVIAAVRGWTVNFHQKGERFKIGQYGIVGRVAASAIASASRSSFLCDFTYGFTYSGGISRTLCPSEAN